MKILLIKISEGEQVFTKILKNNSYYDIFVKKILFLEYGRQRDYMNICKKDLQWMMKKIQKFGYQYAKQFNKIKKYLI